MRERLGDGWGGSRCLFLDVPAGQLYQAPAGKSLAAKSRERPISFNGGVEITVGEPAPGGTTMVARADTGLLAPKTPESLAD